MRNKTIIFLCVANLFFCTIQNSFADVIKIGWIGPLSGNSAIIGEQSLKAIKLAVSEYNQEQAGKVESRQVELFVEDDQYQVAKTISAYQRLRQKDVNIFFVLTYGALFALKNTVVKDKSLILDSLDCNDQIATLPSNFLCLATRTESIAEAFAGDIRGRGYKRVGILYEQSDEWMEYLVQTTKHKIEEIENINLEIEGVMSNAVEYSSSISKLKNKNIQALIMIGNDQFGTAIAQLKQLNFLPQIYGIGSFQSPNFLKLSGVLPANTKISSWMVQDNDHKKALISKFNEVYNSLPELEFVVLPSYDLTKIMLDCLNRKGSRSTPIVNFINNCILSTNNYLGASGVVTFESDGVVRSFNERLVSVTTDK